jgi:hypothetical protein
MARQTSRHEEHGVDADVVAGAGIACRQPLGGDRDPPQPLLVEGDGRAVLAGPRLDLDKGQDAAAPGDQVDLAAGNPGAAGEDAPAVQAQPPGRDPLGLAPALLGQLAPVQRTSSRARA